MKIKKDYEFAVNDGVDIWKVNKASFLIEGIIIFANLSILFYLIKVISSLSLKVNNDLLIVILLVLIFSNIRIRQPSIRLHERLVEVKNE